jgi:hypothetical protein
VVLVFDTIFGLPVHILVIHAVVVLVPLCAVGVIVAAVSRTWRERLAVPIVVLLTFAVASAFVAKLSGQKLYDRLIGGGLTPSDDLVRHTDLGRWAPWVVLAFWIIVVAWLAVAGNRERADGIVVVLAVLAVAAGIGATAYIALVGDAGSRSVWKGTIDSTD